MFLFTKNKRREELERQNESSERKEVKSIFSKRPRKRLMKKKSNLAGDLYEVIPTYERYTL